MFTDSVSKKTLTPKIWSGSGWGTWLTVWIRSLLWSIWPSKCLDMRSWQNQQTDCAPSEVSDQPGHPPSLIRAFAVRMKKAWVLSCPLSAKRRLWSDWADANLSLRWAQSHFVGFEAADIWNAVCVRHKMHFSKIPEICVFFRQKLPFFLLKILFRLNCCHFHSKYCAENHF